MPCYSGISSQISYLCRRVCHFWRYMSFQCRAAASYLVNCLTCVAMCIMSRYFFSNVFPQSYLFFLTGRATVSCLVKCLFRVMQCIFSRHVLNISCHCFMSCHFYCNVLSMYHFCQMFFSLQVDNWPDAGL